MQHRPRNWTPAKAGWKRTRPGSYSHPSGAWVFKTTLTDDVENPNGTHWCAADPQGQQITGKDLGGEDEGLHRFASLTEAAWWLEVFRLDQVEDASSVDAAD